MLYVDSLHLPVAQKIFKSLSLCRKKVWSVLLAYYSATIINAVLDGVGIVLLVGIFTGGMESDTNNPLMRLAHDMLRWLGFEPTISIMLVLVTGVFLFRLFLYFGIISLDGLMSAILRRHLQEKVFIKCIEADWSMMHNWRMGEFIGINTMEAEIVVKYLTSVIRAAYFAMTTLIMVLIAIWVSWQVSAVMMFIAIPMLILLQWIFSVQSRLSVKFANTRKEFTADITERLNGLLQIKVEDNDKYHIKQGLIQQKEMTRIQIVLSYLNAATASYNILLPVVVLLGMYGWAFFIGVEFSAYLELIAGVGVLGSRISSQLNGVISLLGNLSRLSGSLYIVNQALEVLPSPFKKEILEKVESILVKDVSFNFSKKVVFSNINFIVDRFMPLVLRGESGS